MTPPSYLTGDWEVSSAEKRAEPIPKHDRFKVANADLKMSLFNCLSLVELKFGNTDPTANMAIAEARALLGMKEPLS